MRVLQSREELKNQYLFCKNVDFSLDNDLVYLKSLKTNFFKYIVCIYLGFLITFISLFLCFFLLFYKNDAIIISFFLYLVASLMLSIFLWWTVLMFLIVAPLRKFFKLSEFKSKRFSEIKAKYHNENQNLAFFPVFFDRFEAGHFFNTSFWSYKFYRHCYLKGIDSLIYYHFNSNPYKDIPFVKWPKKPKIFWKNKD